MSVVESGLRVGFPFGSRYILGERIGQGNHAVVHRARTREQDVALKITTDTRLGNLATHEQQIHRSLDHPNILPYQNGGRTESGLIYTELALAHDSLASIIEADGPPEIAVAVLMMANVAYGLDYLHTDSKVLHRDIKPSNLLLLNDQNHVVIADFGIAMRYPNDPFFTPNNENYGSVAYAAPERLIAPPTTTPASDVYSMAAVAGEIITGQRLFTGEDINTIAQKQIYTSPPSFEDLVGTGMMTHTISEIEVVVNAGLAKEPTERPTAGDFGEELITVLYCAQAEEAKQRTILDVKGSTRKFVPTPATKGTLRMPEEVEKTKQLRISA